MDPGVVAMTKGPEWGGVKGPVATVTCGAKGGVKGPEPLPTGCSSSLKGSSKKAWLLCMESAEIFCIYFS